MKNPVYFLLAIILLTANLLFAQRPDYVLVIHGGAGNITPERFSAEKQLLYEQELTKALAAGEEVLSNGGSALDAVVAAIQVMEECPLFNSGKGAV